MCGRGGLRRDSERHDRYPVTLRKSPRVAAEKRTGEVDWPTARPGWPPPLHGDRRARGREPGTSGRTSEHLDGWQSFETARPPRPLGRSWPDTSRAPDVPPRKRDPCPWSSAARQCLPRVGERETETTLSPRSPEGQ